MYVGVSPSVRIFCNVTQIIALTSSHFVGRFYRSAVTPSEYSTLLLLRLVTFQAIASSWEGIITFRTLLSFFSFATSLWHFADTVGFRFSCPSDLPLFILLLKLPNNFCWFLSFCTFIIAYNFDLSRGF